ncbi:site-specific integrase [Levilactobacillus brevis]|uniref:site-specific integrase n=1 Tax=Levilactobacillus brevis TaxID=1580 RepID=UPI00352F0163
MTQNIYKQFLTLHVLNHQFSKNTIKAYHCDIHGIKTFLSDYPDVSWQNLESYTNFLLSSDYSPKTIQRKLIILHYTNSKIF